MMRFFLHKHLQHHTSTELAQGCAARGPLPWMREKNPAPFCTLAIVSLSHFPGTEPGEIKSGKSITKMRVNFW